MTLTFRRQDSYGRERYYPVNSAAKALVEITGRVCLNPQELSLLRESGGYVITVTSDNVTETKLTPTGGNT